MNSAAQGVLALWHDCAPENHPEFERWYQTEHLFERLGIDGFLRGRRYLSVGDGPQFFTYYETHSAQVLQSAEYLQRLNNPTELTSRVMSGMFTNMSRTICEVIERRGRFRGSCACTVKLTTVPEQNSIEALLSELGDHRGIARSEFWVATELPPLELSAEEKMRGGDSRIVACLLVEVLREQDAADVVALVQRALAGAVSETGCYRLLCELATDD